MATLLTWHHTSERVCRREGMQEFQYRCIIQKCRANLPLESATLLRYESTGNSPFQIHNSSAHRSLQSVPQSLFPVNSSDDPTGDFHFMPQTLILNVFSPDCFPTPGPRSVVTQCNQPNARASSDFPQQPADSSSSYQATNYSGNMSIHDSYNTSKPTVKTNSDQI